MMGPTELRIYDFDQTLYDSPSAPAGQLGWYFTARSLAGWKPPGFDSRWNMDILLDARHAGFDSRVVALLCTARPGTPPLRKLIGSILASTEVQWAGVELKPVLAFYSDAEYKARVVLKWLRKHPSVRHVWAADDRPENLAAMQVAALRAGRSFEPVLVRFPRSV
jgi:hypothetical protein